METHEKIKIVIADHHPAFREGLRHLLMETGGLEVTGETEDGEEGGRLWVKYPCSPKVPFQSFGTCWLK